MVSRNKSAGCSAAAKTIRSLPGGLLIPPSSMTGSRTKLCGLDASTGTPLELPAIKSRQNFDAMNSDEHSGISHTPMFAAMMVGLSGPPSPSAEQYAAAAPLSVVSVFQRQH
jgi:hypothetical protein